MSFKTLPSLPTEFVPFLFLSQLFPETRCLQDMVATDPSLARPFEALKDAVQDGQALSGLLDMEGLPKTMQAEEYITYMVRRSHTLRLFRASR